MITKHTYHECNEQCWICEGGLGLCEVCGGFEGQLLTSCPGYRLNQETLDACYQGNVKDFVWFKTALDHGARIQNGTLVWR